MRIIDGFKLRTVMGKPIIVAEGVDQVNFNRIISLNTSAAVLWESVVGKDFTVDDLADTLVARYQIDRGRALADAQNIADLWVQNDLAKL